MILYPKPVNNFKQLHVNKIVERVNPWSIRCLKQKLSSAWEPEAPGTLPHSPSHSTFLTAPDVGLVALPMMR